MDKRLLLMTSAVEASMFLEEETWIPAMDPSMLWIELEEFQGPGSACDDGNLRSPLTPTVLLSSGNGCEFTNRGFLLRRSSYVMMFSSYSPISWPWRGQELPMAEGAKSFPLKGPKE